MVPESSPMTKESFRLGNLEIRPPLVLAPMAGLTHSALRSIIAQFGGVGLYSTEMLSAKSIPFENPENSPYLIRTARETPLSYQLLVGQASHVRPAVERLEALGAAAIDLNLGCGAPKVRKLGCGIALWEDEDRLKEVVWKIRSSTDLPFTAKIRLGPCLDRAMFRRRLLLLEALGLDALYIHARLDREPFSRKPRWEWAGLAKQWLGIPIIINGGIFSLEDATRCLAQSNADGLMIGRAAAIMPWIFSCIASGLSGLSSPPPQIDLPAIYHSFCHGLISRFPQERRIGRLKEFTHYFSRNYPFGNRLAMAVQGSTSMSEAMEKADRFFERNRGTERFKGCP